MKGTWLFMPKAHVPNKIRREQSDLKILRAAVKNFGKFGYANSSIYQIA